MKRTFVLLICLLLTVSFLTACQPDDSDLDVAPSIADLSGTDLAKLLLADKRLDSSLLDNDNIFASGVQTFNTLAARAVSYRTVTFAADPLYDKIGDFTISGNVAEWSDFVEYNNSYSYFDNITSIITDIALKGASFIDEAKQTITVVDCWIKDGNEKYYLAVDENSETICKSDSTELFICKRYTDDDGKTVYELYIEQESVYERVKYIPDERYELTQVLSFEETQELYFVADHSKGYWETFLTDDGYGNYDAIFTIMKDDICYSLDYNVSEQSVATLGIMSADTLTDIMTIYGNEYTLSLTMKFAGFDGIKKATADKNYVDINGNYLGDGNIVVYLDNGKTLTPDTRYGNVLLDRIYMDGLADGYVGSCDLIIDGDTEEERWNNFSAFLEENGLSCRRDWSTVVNGVDIAEEDADNLIRYYQWNNHQVADSEGMQKALDVEKNRVAEMKKIYTDIKDKTVVLKNNQSDDLSIPDFAQIITYDFRNVSLEDGRVEAEALSLSVDDVTLLEKNLSYVLALAIVSKTTDNMVLVAKGAPSVYDASASLTVTAESLSFELPRLTEDRYEIVAFIATSDGIKVSACQPLEFDSVSHDNVESVDKYVLINTSEYNSRMTVTFDYLTTTEHNVHLESSEIPSYEDFLETVSASVFVYGTPSNEKLEKLSADGYVTVSPDEEITSGTYRMAYTVSNGDRVTEGYVYVDYVIK